MDSFTNCLIALLSTGKTAKTSFSAPGGHIRVVLKKGEKAYFFAIDGTAGRQALKLTDGQICDCLVAFLQDAAQSEVLCLVEAKGRHLESALKQIHNTYLHLKQALEENPCQFQIQKVVCKAYIYHHGYTPAQIKNAHFQHLMDHLKKVFQEVNISRNEDIGPFLRK